MPIIFPVSVIEKVVEKVVEKIVEKIIYVAVDLYGKATLAYRYVTDVIKPSVNVIAETIADVKNILIPPYTAFTKVVHSLISKPSFPSVDVVAQTLCGVLLRVAGLRLPLPKLRFRFISDMVKPTVSFILGVVQPFISRSVIAVRKPTLSLQLISQPAKPSPTTTILFSTSVGVRKSP